MPPFAPTRHAYRDDPHVPPFDDRFGVVVFDGECVLCSRSMRLLVRLDRNRRFRLATAQGPIGQGLYRHCGLSADGFETYLVVIDGRVLTRSDAVIALVRALPWPWRALAASRVVPRPFRDAAYDLLARHRYRLFGRADYCALVGPEMRERLI